MKSAGLWWANQSTFSNGIVHLGVRHRARVEPDVEHVLDAPHGRLARRVVGVRARQLVDVGPVQVVGTHPEVALQLVETAVHVDPRIARVVGLPDRNGAAPVAVSRYRPVPGVGQPLAELAVLDVLGIPGDLLVELDHPVAEVGDLDEPRRHRAVDQGVPAPPAVRVGVVVGLVANEDRPVHRGRPRLVLQIADDVRVGSEDVLARVVGHRRVERPLESTGVTATMSAASDVALSSSP